MEDVRYVKFFIRDYGKVYSVMSRKAVSSFSESGLETFLFSDSSSATMPLKKKPTVMMLTVRYSGRQYPSYLGKLEKCLSKMSVLSI